MSLILCPLPEQPKADGTRPGPCHIYGRCPDLNPCELQQRCTHGGLGPRCAAPAEPAAPEHVSESDGGN